MVYVNAVKRKEIDAPIDMTKRRDIVATRGGVVTGVLCEQGTALVKAGDIVKAGDGSADRSGLCRVYGCAHRGAAYGQRVSNDGSGFVR